MDRILVVDDEESIQILYADELNEEGYEVFTTGDASNLMDMIEQVRPDLIILDIRLGEYDGLDLLQDIRNIRYNMPVILCTGYPGFKRDLRAIAADFYELKSSDLRGLKRKIKLALEGGRQMLPAASRRDVPIPMTQMRLAW
jgi:DNA-binding NtrC family response regulator